MLCISLLLYSAFTSSRGTQTQAIVADAAANEDRDAAFTERWHASWENNLRLAQLADEIGIECMVPIARWKGYGGESNPNGSSFESIAWACGLLAATRRLQVFCTVHVPLHHPLVAAKQMDP